MTDALATVIPAVVSEVRPDWLDALVLRRALRHYARFLPDHAGMTGRLKLQPRCAG